MLQANLFKSNLFIKLLITSCFLITLFFIVKQPVLAEPIVKISPTKVFQGTHIVVDVEDDEKKSNTFSATINKVSLKLVKIGDRLYRAYIGFPADIKPDKYVLQIKNDESNKAIANIKLDIKERKTGSQNISYYKPKLKKEDEDKIKKEDELVENAKKTVSEKQFWDSPFIFPVNDSVSAIYGIKRYLNGNYNRYHTGVDFYSAFGEKIKATNSGKILIAQYFSKYNSNGNLVYIDHGTGVGSVYLHLSKILVKEGEIVKKGQVIGLVGSSGRSTGPHLHWGLYLNGQNTDGVNWVKFSQEFFKK